MNTRLAFTMSYHTQVGDQSERSEQMFIHAIRCAVNGKFDQSNWEQLLPVTAYSKQISKHVHRVHPDTMYASSETTITSSPRRRLQLFPCPKAVSWTGVLAMPFPRGLNAFRQMDVIVDDVDSIASYERLKGSVEFTP
jgi:hypothetical protein